MATAKDYIEDKYSDYPLEELRDIRAKALEEHEELTDEIEELENDLSKLRSKRHKINIEIEMMKKTINIKKGKVQNGRSKKAI